MHSAETVVVLVALATVVAAFAGRLRVPAPSLLAVTGLLAGLVPGVPQVHVPPSVVSLVVLPPLLYAASEELPWRDVRAVWRPVVILAVGLVLASAAAVAAGLAVAAGAVLLRRRLTDPVLETVAALLTLYVAYLLGEVLHVSGVTAMTAGPLTSSVVTVKPSARSRAALAAPSPLAPPVTRAVRGTVATLPAA